MTGEVLGGGCTCKAVRYELAGLPMFVNCCHCTDCQTESGSAFAINALYEAGRLRLTEGRTEPLDTPSASGKGQTVHRCPDCKVALWSHYAGAGEAVAFVRVGTLDAPATLAPDIHIYTRSKLPWMTLPEGVPAVEGYYNPRETWPQEAQLRWKAALGKA